MLKMTGVVALLLTLFFLLVAKSAWRDGEGKAFAVAVLCVAYFLWVARLAFAGAL